MDNVYKPSQFSASCDIHIKEYFQPFSNTVNFINKLTLQENEQDEEIFKLMGLGLNRETKTSLKNACSVKLLESNVDSLPKNIKGMKSSFDSSYKHVPSEAKSLETIKNLESNTKQSGSMHKENTDLYLNNLKYRSEIEIDDTNLPNLENLKENDDVLLFIRIYLPFRYIPGLKSAWVPRFSHEIIVLGSNTIQDFCNKILCPSDETVSCDISENPEIALQPSINTKGKCKYRSSLIYMGDTLYHNAKDSKCVDYTEVVMQWSQQLSNCVGPFKKELMDKVMFKDVKIKLGYPHMYQHQGDCEHLFTISDVRLLHSTDSLSSMDYPRFACATNKITRRCMMCGPKVARYIVRNCDRLPSDPTYLCDLCFKSYLYVDGKKIDNFKAYLYFDSSYML